MTTLSSAAAQVTAACQTVPDVPTRAVGDLTAVGPGPALVVLPPAAVGHPAQALWDVEVTVIVIGDSHLDAAGLVHLADTTMAAVAAAGLPCTARPTTVQIGPDTRTPAYELTVEV